jgi:hypothetical protein
MAAFGNHYMLAGLVVQVSDQVDIGMIFDFVEIFLADGEKQLVVFATIECASNRVDFKIQ